MAGRKGGWQVWVDVHDDHVIKTPKSRREIAREIRRFLVWKGQPLSGLKKLTDKMVDDAIKSIMLVKKSACPRRFFGDAEFLDGGKIRQRKALVLEERLRQVSGDVRSQKRIIRHFFKLVTTLWEYGIHEKTFKFHANYGVINDDEVILIDFLEITGRKTTAKKQIRRAQWAENVEMTKVLDEITAAYFRRRVSEIYSLETLDKYWKRKRSGKNR